MFLEKKIVPNSIPSPITAEIAQEIYGFLKECGCASMAFTEKDKYHFCYYEDTTKEIEAIESVIKEEMSRPTEQPDPRVVINDETGEEETIQDTIILRPTTQAELKERLHSDLLDLDLIIQDYMDYVLTYVEGTTWEDFVAQFNS